MAYQLSNSFDNLPGGFNTGDYTPTSGWTGLIFGGQRLYGSEIVRHANFRARVFRIITTTDALNRTARETKRNG